MRVYSQEIIGFMNLFEHVTRANLKDCFLEGDTVVFVVEEGMMGKALGKQASNIRKLSSLLKKQVRLLEFHPDPAQFVLGLLYPVKPQEVNFVEGAIHIVAHDMQEKGKIFGREKSNLKRVQEIVRKYFPVEIKVD